MIDTSINIDGAFCPETMTDTQLVREVLGEEALGLLGETVEGLRVATYGEIESVYGARRAKVFCAARELARRAVAARWDRKVPYGNSRDIKRVYAPRLGPMREEVCIAVMLDAKNRPMAEVTLGASGDANFCTVSPGTVVKAALRSGCTGVILVHNHPSGDPAPSEEDIAFTKRVSAALKLVDLALLDHVVIVEDGCFSFLDGGLLRS